MSRWSKKLWPATRVCADALLSVACWTLWLALLAGLVIQIGIALSHELTVPKFVLRKFEERFQASNFEPRFGRATFDPGGGILLENLQLSLPGYQEPVIEIRAIYLELDPWQLLAGQFEPREIHATGVRLFIPAMLSPTGRSEEMLGDLELVLHPHDDRLAIRHLATRFAGMTVTALGVWQLNRPPGAAQVRPLPLLENLAENYPALCRRLVEVASRLSVLEHPHLHAVLEPSTNRGAIAAITLSALSVKLPELQNLVATGVRASARLPLLDDAPAPSALDLSADEIRLDGVVARHVAARVHGLLDLTPFSFTPGETDVSISQLSCRGFALDAALAHIDPRELPALRAHFVAANMGRLVAVDGLASLSDKSATLRFVGSLSPALLEPISALVGRDVRRFVDFGAPVHADLSATFSPGWAFQRVDGRVAADRIDAYLVPIDSVRSEVAFDGQHFIARNARATLGDNVARGRFEQDLKSREFRFLLEGRLRPLAISGWFREWWPNFFNHFEFPHAPPDASVEVAGRWGAAHETSVFVFAESHNPIVRGARLDYARTRMFIRPSFIDGLELFGTRGAGEVRGTFTRHIDPATRQWREMDLSLASTLDLVTGAALLGPDLGPRLEPFSFERSPQIRVTAHFEGPAAANGEHQEMRIEAESTGAFSAYRFPARNLSFDAVVRDDEVTLERVEAAIAGGTLSGNARLWGSEADRRLGFDALLQGASLGQAASAVVNYIAERRGDPPPPADKLLPGRNSVRLDLTISAEGLFADPFSYDGAGNVTLEGPELGEVRLLGLLSELLQFTALRFTAARGEFRVEGPKIVFSSFNATGASSAVHAHGDYSLDRRALDFNARVYPFLESKSLLQNVVGAVLTPLSNMLEVRLTGGLDDPKWAFVIGPTNLFRSLNQPSGLPGPPAAPATSPAPTPPGAGPSKTEKTH